MPPAGPMMPTAMAPRGILEEGGHPAVLRDDTRGVSESQAGALVSYSGVLQGTSGSKPTRYGWSRGSPGSAMWY